MFLRLAVLLQRARPAPPPPEPEPDWVDHFLEFVDTPAPFSPLSEYLLLLFVLWLIARVQHRKTETFESQAQDVLEEKYRQGELSPEAYEKYRDLTDNQRRL